MCTALDLRILNGCTEGDHKGRYTYISVHSSSVIDYAIASDDVRSVVRKLTVSGILSTHLPLVLAFQMKQQPNNTDSVAREEKSCWRCDLVDTFLSELKGCLTKSDDDLFRDGTVDVFEQSDQRSYELCRDDKIR